MASELRQRRRSQVAKAVVCKTIIHQFDSDRRLHAYNGLQAHACNPFFFCTSENPHQSAKGFIAIQNLTSTC